MHFNTFFMTTVMLALANATPAMMRRYGNETTSDFSSLTTTETMPSMAPSNSTAGPGASISTSVTQNLITTVESTTLTYTLGPKGSSSVVTTVVESTSTITMTSTMYITLTQTEGAASTADPTTTDLSEDPSPTDPGSGLTPSDPGDDPIGTAEPTSTGFDEPPAGASPSDGPIVSNPGSDIPTTEEPTITVTDYLTTTETITLQAVETGASGAAVPDDGTNFSAGSDTGNGGGGGGGAFFQSNGPYGGTDLPGGQGGLCGVMTVTATMIEMSTVTVFPSSTDNFPVPPTASPSYGNGNGTDPLPGYPTASSGFLTFYRRARPTRL